MEYGIDVQLKCKTDCERQSRHERFQKPSAKAVQKPRIYGKLRTALARRCTLSFAKKRGFYMNIFRDTQPTSGRARTQEREEKLRMNAENYQFFKENLPHLLKAYQNKFLVIKDMSVVGVYDTFDTAYMETTKIHQLGTFIIQECVPDDPKTHIRAFRAGYVFNKCICEP
jgi:hypothetical protein